MTVRARLLVGLLVLTALGLSVAGVVTYHEQKTFLSQRVNQQLASALAAPQQLNVPGDLPTGNTAVQPLPFGTYAELRYPDGTATSLSSSDVARPRLPSSVVVGQVFTVHNPSFRVDSGPVETRFGRAVLVVAIPLHDMTDSLHRLLFIELITGTLVLLALALLTYLVVNFGLRPIHEMEETAGKIAAGDLSQRVDVIDENTEVGRLGVAFNKMLEEIETAFDERAQSEARLRRFVADASHELRTPLTSIRGYAELFRRGAADRPEDLAKAMRRIEEEANRMGVLVDDLLLLARLDQGRPLEERPVDLTRITRDAVDDARTVAPNRPIDYSPNGAIIVPGDEVRLRQVLANLMQNTLQHTPPDTPVHVRVEAGIDNAVIEVRDEGPGMSSETAAHVFERFWRGDPSRNRASGGAGLGLAIVAAIADAHGGRAEVESAPGQGATFRVVLPRTPQSPSPEPVAVEL